MNLSIVIPNYNYVCVPLVHDLQKLCSQCAELTDYEIVVADDGSSRAETLEANRAINSLPHCQYCEHASNMGRSRILHKNVLQAQLDWVLIIDSDAKVADDAYISNYIAATSSGKDVIMGGISTSTEYLNKNNTLRYKYEHNASGIRMLEYRNQHPYQHLSSFNILVKATVFQTVNFDNSLEQYGYEDTLFGIDLQRNNIPVLHINNPLIHTGIDTNESYLRKTEQALQNLVILKDKLSSDSNLYQAYNKLSKAHLVWAIRLWHSLFHRVEKTNLLSSHPSLFIFNLYKLGYFAQQTKQLK